MLFIGLVFAGVGALLMVGVVQKRAPRLRSIASGLLVTYFTLILLFLLVEGYFRFVFAEPDGLPTLAQQNWMARYWRKNALGYRDRDWSPSDWANKKTVLVVGDSFTAGGGIANPQDRFADVLASRLGAGYAVMNVGLPGASTPDETENLRRYPVKKPDIVIWQYTLNDIEKAALSIGIDPGLNPLRGVPDWAAQSYLGNFAYWRLARRAQPDASAWGSYIGWLNAMYDHSVVWDIHRHEINAFIDLVEREGAQFYAVIFPHMDNPIGSIAYVDRVAQAIAARGYADHTLKLFDQAEAMPLKERVVSERDAHPSARFHHLVGDLLYQQITAGR
jgi:lysophospholipase L1-like esterase